MPAIPFKRTLKTGARGSDVRAVKRGLALSGVKGTGRLRDITRPAFYGPLTVIRMKRFQRSVGLKADGVYGPKTHHYLQQRFDRYARLLYTKPDPVPPPPAQGLQLPKTFTPTHQTAGLAGYPAIDVFAKPGTVVLSPDAGTIDQLSGRDPATGGSPGGSYGWTMYLKTRRGRYFLTHFGERFVTLNQRVKTGERIGTVQDCSIAGMSSSASHIHEGFDAK